MRIENIYEKWKCAARIIIIPLEEVSTILKKLFC